MDKIEKLFRRLTEKERKALKNAITGLIAGKKNEIKKIEASNYYHLRAGNFRIIFHYSDIPKSALYLMRFANETTIPTKIFNINIKSTNFK